MLPVYCTDIEEYRSWIKGPPALYDCEQPRYETKKAAVEEVDGDELNDWISGLDAKEFLKIPVLAVAQEPTLQERFFEQTKKLRRETQHLSSPGQIMMHPSYQAILGMGNDHRNEVIELMIADMAKNRTPWFWALSYLAQDNPVSQSDAGNTDKMIKAWVNWEKVRRMR